MVNGKMRLRGVSVGPCFSISLIAKRIGFLFLHLRSFGHTATSGSRKKLLVSAGYFGSGVLKTNLLKLQHVL